MTDSERIQEIQEQNEAILARLDLIEESLKTILVNDVLNDAEHLIAGHKFVREPSEPAKENHQHRITELENLLAAEQEIHAELQTKLAEQTANLRFSQQLADDQEHTIKLQDEKIRDLQKQLNADSNTIIWKARSMNALRIGAAYRIPHGYCRGASGKVWRIVEIDGSQVLLRIVPRHGRYNKYEQWFPLREILQFYEAKIPCLPSY